MSQVQDEPQKNNAGKAVEKPCPPDMPAEQPLTPAHAPYTPDHQPSATAKSVGEWAYRNRDTFTSPQGRLAFRNVTKTLVGIVPTVIAFNAVNHGFNAYNKAEHLSGGIHKYIKPLTKNKLFEGGVYVFAGYTAFRAFCKIVQRNYDRIFAKADDPSTAIEAVDNLPKNIVSDFKEVIGPEMAGTAVAALPLAAIRGGFRNGEGRLDGNMAQAMKGYPRDYLGSVAAYIAFFEANDRIYNDVSGNKDTPGYYKKLAGEECKPVINDHAHKKYAFFTEDGAGRLMFRRGGELMLGMASHIGLQRRAWAKFGHADPNQHSFATNLAKDYGAYAGFSTYTAAAEVYNNAYDKLFARLEEQERAKDQLQKR